MLRVIGIGLAVAIVLPVAYVTIARLNAGSLRLQGRFVEAVGHVGLRLASMGRFPRELNTAGQHWLASIVGALLIIGLVLLGLWIIPAIVGERQSR